MNCDRVSLGLMATISGLAYAAVLHLPSSVFRLSNSLFWPLSLYTLVTKHLYESPTYRPLSLPWPVEPRQISAVRDICYSIYDSG